MKKHIRQQKWFSDVLDECLTEIENNTQTLEDDGYILFNYNKQGNVFRWHERNLQDYLTNQLGTTVTVIYNYNQKEGSWYTIKIEWKPDDITRDN